VHISWTNATDIQVKIWDKLRSLHLVDQKTIDSGVSVNNSVLLIHSYSPAFNFHTCQHVAVDVLIPFKFAASLSIGGLVKVGEVSIRGESDVAQYLGNIDIVVEVGHIKVEDVKANSLTLSSELGHIAVVDSVVAQSVKLDVHTGSIKTNDISAKNMHSVNRFGCSYHYDLVSDNVKIDTKFGFSSVHKASTLGSELDLAIDTEYGKSLFVTSLDSHELNYTLSTTKGDVLLEYEDEFWQCAVQKSKNGVMNGKCLSTLKYKSVKVNMNTKYGQTTLIADNLEEQEDD